MAETPVVTPGGETTEYAVAKSNSLWGIVTMALGVIVAVGPELVSNLPVNSTAALVCGAVITCAGAIMKVLSGLAYTKSRADVKVAASISNATQSK